MTVRRLLVASVVICLASCSGNGGAGGAGGGEGGGVAAGGGAGGGVGGGSGGGVGGGLGGGSGGGVGGGAGGGIGGGMGGGTGGGVGGGGGQSFDAGDDAGTDGGFDAGAADAGEADAGLLFGFLSDGGVCALQGASCALATDCCTGVCLPTATWNAYTTELRCSASPIAACKALSTTCTLDSDCCSGQCLANSCVDQDAGCHATITVSPGVYQYGACSDDTDCCGQWSCNIYSSQGVRTLACLDRAQQQGRIYPGFACSYNQQCYYGICSERSDGGTNTCASPSNTFCGGYGPQGGSCFSTGTCCAGLDCDLTTNKCKAIRGTPCDGSSECLSGTCNANGLCE